MTHTSPPRNHPGGSTNTSRFGGGYETVRLEERGHSLTPQDLCLRTGPRMPPPHSTFHPPQHTNINFRESLTKVLQYSQTTSQIPRPTSQICSPNSQISHTQPLKSSLNQSQPLKTCLKSFSSFSLNLSNSHSFPPNRQTPTQTIPLHKQARFNTDPHDSPAHYPSTSSSHHHSPLSPSSTTQIHAAFFHFLSLSLMSFNSHL
jgi:hypothetical protein